MGGGIVQLVTNTGKQDGSLTGDPETTFLKGVYRRYTNFAKEHIKQTLNGTPTFGSQNVTATVFRSGDLISDTYLEVTLPAIPQVYPSGFVDPTTGAAVGGTALPAGAFYGWTNSVGHALIEEVKCEIGGLEIDKKTGEWMEVWDELTLPESKVKGYYHMIGKYEAPEDSLATSAINAKVLHIPIQFWYSKGHYFNSLPIVALQLHDVKLTFRFRAFRDLVTFENLPEPDNITNFTNIDLYIDYIYVDSDERQMFVDLDHEYLIEQLQYQKFTINANTLNYNAILNFNHPGIELVWTLTEQERIDSNDYFNFAKNTDADGVALAADAPVNAPLSKAKLTINNTDRFSERDESYFRLTQPWQGHTRVPTKHIYSYSFALKPEEHQPSGTMNFSRLDNSQLELTFPRGMRQSSLVVYLRNYNWLKVTSGVAGTAFSS